MSWKNKLACEYICKYIYNYIYNFLNILFFKYSIYKTVFRKKRAQKHRDVNTSYLYSF